MSKLRVSPSLHSLESWPSLWPTTLKAMLPTCFSSFSWSFSRFIWSSCSLNFPNKEVMVNVVKSLDSEIALTFGCQDLSKLLRILMFSSSLSKILPRLMRWFTMWVNLFYTFEMVSPLNILHISYSWIMTCFLALFTLVMPSWVTLRVSHISFVDAHC